MGLFSRFEDKAESVIEGGSRGRGGIEPVKLAKRAFKEMQREKMVGVGHEYAPTLYNILVSPEDDAKMSGYYPSLAGEVETYLSSKAKTAGLVFDCPPLVRFIVDDGLKRGRFDIIAENVSAAIIADLREEELEHYGLKKPQPDSSADASRDPFTPSSDAPASQTAQPEPQPEPEARPLTGYDSVRPLSEEASAKQPAPEPAPEPVPVPEPVVAHVPAAAPTPEPAPAVVRTYPPTEAPAETPAAADAAPLARDSADRTVFLGAPATPKPQAHLYDFSTQVTHDILGERTIIGRGSSCDIVIGNPSVSRHHAEILHSETGWLIRDTGSTNGMSVNGSRASQSALYTGDIISLGTTDLEFREA